VVITVRYLRPFISLQRASGRDRPRIHWCPSGAFAMLPLHAAGIYDSANPVCTADYAVSSYIPSLSSLIKARENYVSITRDQLQTLLVAQPKPPDMEPLVSVEEEVQTIAGLMVSSSATVLNDVYEIASVDSVLKTLPQAHVLHLACHGQQSADPLSSSFAFCDGPLPISALMKLDLPNATLAFLSACETAKGHAKLPDQAVHLAASLLFCGFRSVIATMW
jgi:CHAT domain-containing protein